MKKALLLVLLLWTGGGAQEPGLQRIDPAALQQVIDAKARQLMVPGALVLLRTPQGEFTFPYGTCLRRASLAPRDDTHFRIASNTKTMTSAVIMQLAQEGRLRLDDPVSKYVSGVPGGDKLTLTDLLTMRSGLYNYTDAPELAAQLDAEPSRSWTPQEGLAIAWSHPLDAVREYHYCNTNYALLGLIIAKLEGKPLPTVYADRLFRPLGLKDTLLPTGTTLPRSFAHGYMYGGSAYALVDIPYPAEMQSAARAGTLAPHDYTAQNPTYAMAAGGAVSSARDMATWIESLVDGKLLNAEYQRRWLTSPRPEDPAHPEGQRYGYGIAQMRLGPNTIYFHGGEMPGFNSFIGRDREHGMTLIVWTNLTVSLDGAPTANALMVRVLGQLYGQPQLGE